MGAWGVGAFENDDALDWLADMADLGVFGVIGTFEAAIAPPVAGMPAPDDAGQIEQASGVVAAGETVACALGHPARGLSGALLAQVKAMGAGLEAQAGIADLALRALEGVLSEDAPLVVLWAEDAEAKAEWDAAISDLRRRLSLAKQDFPGTWELTGGGVPIGTFRAVVPLDEIDVAPGPMEDAAALAAYLSERLRLVEDAVGLWDPEAAEVTLESGPTVYFARVEERFALLESAWEVPGAADRMPLPDLGDAASRRAAADRFRARFERLVAHIERRRETMA